MKLLNKLFRTNIKDQKGEVLSLSKGFTLIELLIYVAIFSSLIGVLSNAFGSILDAQLESKSYSAVDQDGRYILAKLSYDFRSADSAETVHNSYISPSASSSGTTLHMVINSIDTTYNLNDGYLKIINNIGANNLNSSETKVSNLSFQRIGPGDNKDTVRVSFTLTSVAKRGAKQDVKDFQTTLSMP